MANKSKNKGKRYERELAEYLKTLTGFSFVRVPNSGAWVGGANQERIKTISKEQLLLADGDLIVPTEWSHVSIEAKNYKDMSWGALFDLEGDRLVNEWVGQASFTTKPLWFLCIKINHKGEWIMFDKRQLSHFNVIEMPILEYRTLYCMLRLKPFFEKNHTKISELRNYYANN